MIKIGLTGNIASGKSEAEKIIANLGYKVIDLDMVTHKLFESDKNVQKKILEKFNTLDRKEIANVIFNSEKRKKELENIIHPELNTYIENFFKENQKEKAVFVSGATIFETGFDKMFDKIILIDAPKEVKIERLMKRNNLTYDEAIKRLNSQTDNKNKTPYVVNNDSSLEILNEKISKLLKILL